MQPLARDGLSASEVTALLEAPALTVSAGCDLLNADLTFAEDISDDLVGGRVSRNLYASIHGTCDLSLSRSLVWGVDLVRPYMTLSDGTVSARFNLGVFALTTPERNVGELPETYSVQGYDRLYDLAREVGEEYVVLAGTTYRQALLDTFAAADLTGVLIEGSAADDVLPADRVWPLVGKSTDPDQTDTPATWLRVINSLLEAIGFRSVWADENGNYRCEAYREPAIRASEFTLSADSALTIVGEDRKLTADIWQTPNRWVAIASNPPEGVVPSIGNGLIQVRDNLDDGPTSQNQRGKVWPSTLSYEAATPAVLSSLVDRRKAIDLRQTTRVSFPTGPLPIAGHADIVTIIDATAGISAKAQAISWELPIDGADMAWDFEIVG